MARSPSPMWRISFSSLSCAFSRRSHWSSAASAFRRATASAEPGAYSSSRQVLSWFGAIPSSAATLDCVAPGAESRATASRLNSGENTRLVRLPILILPISD